MDAKKIASLDDETFFDLAAKAYFFEKRTAENLKDGLMLAIAEMVKSL